MPEITLKAEASPYTWSKLALALTEEAERCLNNAIYSLGHGLAGDALLDIEIAKVCITTSAQIEQALR